MGQFFAINAKIENIVYLITLKANKKVFLLKMRCYKT